MSGFHRLQLHTPRLRLRPMVQRDAPALLAMFSDPQVMQFWSSTPWTSLARARSYLREEKKALASGTYLRLGIERREDAVLLGMCTLFDFMRQCRRAEIGYALARAHWGRGYMHEALGELLRYGFEELDLHRVEADIDPRNEASARSLERHGFRAEGLLRERWIVEGVVSDSRFYGLLRSEWSALAQPRGQQTGGCDDRQG